MFFLYFYTRLILNRQQLQDSWLVTNWFIIWFYIIGKIKYLISVNKLVNICGNTNFFMFLFEGKNLDSM